jgi:hypothetical protein
LPAIDESPSSTTAEQIFALISSGVADFSPTQDSGSIQEANSVVLATFSLPLDQLTSESVRSHENLLQLQLLGLE